MRAFRLSVAASLLCFALVGSGCDLVGPKTRVAQGQLFTSGTARYDGWFREVHSAQLAAAAWPDERKQSRKALTQALGLLPSSDDALLVDAAGERAATLGGGIVFEPEGTPSVAPGPASKSDAAFFRALEETAKAERARRERVRGQSVRAEQLGKSGDELKPHVEEDFGKGEDRTKEVRAEVLGGIDEMHKLVRSAEAEIKGSESFLADLKEAVAADPARSPGRRKHRKGSSPQPSNVAPAATTPEPTADPDPPPPQPPAEPAPEPPAGALPPPPPPPPVQELGDIDAPAKATPKAGKKKGKPKAPPRGKAKGKGKGKPAAKPAGESGDVFNP